MLYKGMSKLFVIFLAFSVAKATASFTAVLAHYHEPFECVNHTIDLIHKTVGAEARILVYSKDRRRTPPLPWVYRYLRNEGREGDVYLEFIINHYYSLPDHVLFSQACPEVKDFETRLVQWSNTTHMFNLGGAEWGTCDGTDYYPMHRLHDVYVLTHASLCPTQKFLSFMQGQFVVSRKRITRNSVEVYHLLQDTLHDNATNEDIYDIKDEDIRNSKLANHENHNANYFSYVLERAWVIIFDCMKTNEEPC